MIENQRGWTIEPTYGGAWIVRDENAYEVAGGMSEQDARHYAKLEAQKRGLPEQTLERLKFDWE